MRFALQLVAFKGLLANVANCFQGDFLKMVKIGDDWFLTSSAFNACSTPVEVFPIADRLLGLMQRITGVYAGLFVFCETGYVQAFDDKGLPTTRALRASQKVQIYTLEGLGQLQEPRGDQSLGSALVALASATNELQEALSLLDEDVHWSHVYNVLEFLGGVDEIVKRKWATRTQLRKCRQTANHYRHFGSPKNYPLPADPPSLGEAVLLIRNLLKKWISRSLQVTGA
jgi:hypothetical protein